MAPRIPWWKIWAENLWQKVLGTIFKKKCHPCMGIFKLHPSKCPCKDFSISLFLHPNNLCWRKRVNFFLILKFRVYKSVSFLSHSVSMIMSRHFYRVILSLCIIGEYWHGIEDLELLIIIYKNVWMSDKSWEPEHSLTLSLTLSCTRSQHAEQLLFSCLCSKVTRLARVNTGMWWYLWRDRLG